MKPAARFRLLRPGSPELVALQESGADIVEALTSSLDDLFRIELPHVAPGSPEYEPTRRRYLDSHWAGGDTSGLGVWAYYPWRHTLVHLPDAETFLRLRTNRNRDLITEVEQTAYYASHVAVAGLSVGFSCAMSLVLTGGAGRLRVADFDELSVTNLNRLPLSVCDVGRSKIVLATRRLLELNPFLEIDCWSQGVKAERADLFLGGANDPVDVLVEEVDDIATKIALRFAARDRGVPVVMATDNGDNAIIDVERFDIEPGRPLFHGRVDEGVLRSVPAEPDPRQRVALANAIVGSVVTARTQASLQRIGTQLVTWPQLGGAASVSGAAVAYVVRRIVTGTPMPSGRYFVDLDVCLDPDFHSPEATTARAAHTDAFERSFELMFGAP